MRKPPVSKSTGPFARSDRPAGAPDQRRTVELMIAGRSFNVSTSASPEELRRLAAIVDGQTRKIIGKGPANPESFVLTALALAHELETERMVRAEVHRRTKESVGVLRDKIDATFRKARIASPALGSKPKSP